MNQILKDRYGNKIGEIRDSGTKQIIYDRYGNKKGYFDGRYTYDSYGNKYGEGNLLAALVN
jgi:hypothetical protein